MFLHTGLGLLSFYNQFEQPDKHMTLAETNQNSLDCKMPAETIGKISSTDSQKQLAWRLFETQTYYKDKNASQLNTFHELCLYLNSPVNISNRI